MEIASLQASDDGAWSCEVILKACLCDDIDSDSDSEDDNDHDIGDSDDDHDDHGNGFDILTFFRWRARVGEFLSPITEYWHPPSGSHAPLDPLLAKVV